MVAGGPSGVLSINSIILLQKANSFPANILLDRHSVDSSTRLRSQSNKRDKPHTAIPPYANCLQPGYQGTQTPG